MNASDKRPLSFLSGTGNSLYEMPVFFVYLLAASLWMACAILPDLYRGILHQSYR